MLYRYFFSFTLLLALVTGSHSFADAFSSSDEITERDYDAILEFLRTKRVLPFDKKEGNLTMSGDVRVEWERVHEKEKGVPLRGVLSPGGCYRDYRASTNQYDMEFSLLLDYQAERAWAAVNLKMDHNAGTKKGNCTTSGSCPGDPEGCHGSGNSDTIALKKAYFGYNMFEHGNSRFDIELGRRHLYHVFDSKLQFTSRFDGLLLRYSNSFDDVGNYYLHLGSFVIDETIEHYGFVGETGLLDLMDTGLDVKYSYIDWATHKTNRCGVTEPRGMMFRNSQISLAYNFNPEFLKNKAKVYGAFLLNHAAQGRVQTNYMKKNYGWYVGFQYGKVVQEGDWNVSINYQKVLAQAVPECDNGGIGRGNVKNLSFTNSSAVNSALSTGGNGNFEGWRVEGLYALTNNFTINPMYERSSEEDATIGGTHSYSKFQMQVIYAF